MEPLLGREHLRRMQRKVIRPGASSKAELSLYEDDTERMAVKDCCGMHPFIKRFFGRRTQKQEVAIYRQLKGLRGIPAFKGVIDPDAFAVEFIEGETLSRNLAPDRLHKALDDLEKVIEAIHARGVVHLDLKQKRNVLVRPDDSVVVVDFQSALSMHSAPWLRCFLSYLQGRDRAGLIKFKGKYAPDLLTDLEVKIFRRERIMARFWPFTHMVRIVRKIFKNET